MLTLSQQALIELLKIHLGNSVGDFPFIDLTEDDWKSVIKQSQIQAVSLMAFDGTKLCKAVIPENIYNPWMELSVRRMMKNSAVVDAQNQLVELLEKNSFNYVILKGTSSASYYPQPDKRNLGDIDFLIEKVKEKDVEQILTDNGYKMTLEGHERHIVFEKNGIDHEMHYEVAGMPDGKPGEIISKYLQNTVKSGLSVQNPVFRSPAPQFHTVIIILHTIHHLLGEGLGLRHLCDWACLVQRTSDSKFWEDEMLPLFKETGLLKFAQILTKTASVYLGTVCPDWAKNVDTELCNNLFCDIILSGNFGRNNKDRSSASKMISAHGKSGTKDGKIKNLYRTLKETMYSSYPILNRLAFLYPFIFIWRIFKYLVLMCFGKRPSLIKSNSFANQRLALYRQFELYENTEEK